MIIYLIIILTEQKQLFLENFNSEPNNFELLDNFNPTPVRLLSYQLLYGGAYTTPPIKTYLRTILTQFLA